MNQCWISILEHQHDPGPTLSWRCKSDYEKRVGAYWHCYCKRFLMGKINARGTFQRLYRQNRSMTLLLFPGASVDEAKLALKLSSLTFGDKVRPVELVQACWETFKSTKFHVIDRFGIVIRAYSKKY